MNARVKLGSIFPRVTHSPLVILRDVFVSKNPHDVSQRVAPESAKSSRWTGENLGGLHGLLWRSIPRGYRRTHPLKSVGILSAKERPQNDKGVECVVKRKH